MKTIFRVVEISQDGIHKEKSLQSRPNWEEGQVFKYMETAFYDFVQSRFTKNVVELQYWNRQYSDWQVLRTSNELKKYSQNGFY